VINESLIKSVKNQERKAFKQLYEKCIGYVFTITKRYISNDSDIPDVIQEIFARVFLSIPSFDASKGEFKYWLRRLVINQCFQHYRQGKSPRLHLALDNTEEVADEDGHHLETLTKEDIEKMLHEMPEGYRQVFLLYIVDEYSHKEIGQLLSITPEASRSQLSRAKKWLRKKKLTNKNKITANGI